MRIRPFALSAVALLMAAPATAAQDNLPPDPTPAELEAARLADTGFETIDKVAAEGRTVRRVTYADIYGEDGIPGVVMEKMANGEVHITVTSNYNRVVDKAVLKPEAWNLVDSVDKDLAAPRKTPVATEICIGSSMVIEATDNGKVRRRDAAVCNGPADAAALDYGRTMAMIAATSIPRCAGHIEHTRDPSWYLRDCLRRSLIAEYKTHPYQGSSGHNNEKFTTYAISTSNNITDEVLRTVARRDPMDFDQRRE
jgi:hypothetical protein